MRDGTFKQRIDKLHDVWRRYKADLEAMIAAAKQEFPDFVSDDTSVHGVIISCYRAWFTKWFGDGDDDT